MIDRAIELARTSEFPQFKIGAIITQKNGRILSSGVNMNKTHPFQAKYADRHKLRKYFLHAEISALVRCKGRPHTIYVARVRRDGSIGICRPCEICFDAIVDAGCKRIVYTKNGGSLGIIDL